MNGFLENVVNIKFREIYTYLEENRLIRGKSDIAKKLGTYNHVVNSILKGKRNITVDQINRLIEAYNINANYVFGCSTEMILGEGPSGNNASLHDAGFVGRTNITLVPYKAVAGYALGKHDKEYLNSLQKFNIPGQEGELIAFEISGDSMLPTITNGDIIICEPLERGEPVKDNSVYVVVTDVVVTKRIQQVRENNIVTRFRLISDNDAVYKPYDVELDEITQILKVKSRLTSSGIY